MLSYETLITQMNRSMLAGEHDRVEILRQVLACLGHPDQRYQIVHLAGTNGKGSTGTMIAQILAHQGYRVGHFASPALIDQREQIQINDQMISQHDFVATYQKIVSQLPSTIAPHQLTIFEWFTVIMLQYFANQGVQWAVIEAGLGGLTDATNAITTPRLTIFTHIDLDHTNILGHTITEIATNKAQIIKSGTSVFVAPNQHAEALEVLKQTALQNGAEQVCLPTAIEIVVNKEGLYGFDLTLTTGQLTNQPLHLGLIGDFQLDNLQTVLMVYDWLVKHSLIDGPNVLVQALAQVRIPGRMQLIGDQPPVILDGAHNPDGTRQLMNSLKHLFPDKKWIFVVGILKDKDYRTMAALYRQFSSQIFVARPDNDQRALGQRQLQQLLPEAQVTVDARTGLAAALKVGDDQSVIVVTGSFYLIKELEDHREN